MGDDGRKKSKEEIAQENKEKQANLKENEFQIDLLAIKKELGIQIKKVGEDSRDDSER